VPVNLASVLQTKNHAGSFIAGAAKTARCN
jgi:hypothetical protein